LSITGLKGKRRRRRRRRRKRRKINKTQAPLNLKVYHWEYYQG
jgi:hypothetical protein